MSKVNMTSQNGIPSPPGATFESTLKALRSYNPVSFITDLAHTYSDILRLPFGTRNLYLLNHPDLINEIFSDESETSFAKRKDADDQKAYLNGIASVAPFFRNKNREDLIAEYASTVLEAVQRTHERWLALSQKQDPLKVDIYRQMMQTTVPVVCKILFQRNLEAESAEIVDKLLTMDVGYGFDTVAAILGDTVPPVEPVSKTPEQEEARLYLLQVMQGEDLLEAFRFMHEVTVTTLSWTWYLLSQHPEVEAQLHTELANVLDERLPTSADFDRLTYTKMILKEARRLYPIVWLIGRFVRHDVSLGGHFIPANSIVLASQKVTHSDERYFPNPDRFDPLRWTPEAIAARPERSFFPFSAGPRQCVGRYFADIEDTLILATLAQHWQARLIPGQVLEPHPQKSLMPRNGIQMILQSR